MPSPPPTSRIGWCSSTPRRTWAATTRLSRHGARLVCCAHGLGYDHHVHDGIRFVMSGGGGAALYLSHKNAGRDRGAVFHAVEITLTQTGEVSGRVFQAFAPPGSGPPFAF